MVYKRYRGRREIREEGRGGSRGRGGVMGMGQNSFC